MAVRYRSYSASLARLQRLRRRAESDSELPPLLGERAVANPAQLGHQDVMHLQRLAGNQAVSEMAAAERSRKGPAETVDGGSRSNYFFNVMVARREGPAPDRTTAEKAAEARHADAPSADAAAGAEEPEEKSEGKGQAEVEETDAVKPALAYNATVGARATPPNATQFGVTSTNVTMSGVRATQVPVLGGFMLTGTVNVSAKWSVHSRGRIDVPYFAAPVVTATSYPQVVKDLKPNMASDGGRPPRRQYWAKDLTERHEKFHADERTGKYGRAAFEFAKTWLASQSVTTAEEAKELADKVPDKMFESYNASFVPGKENRAYGDGAIAYQVRSDMAKTYGEELKKKAAGP